MLTFGHILNTTVILKKSSEIQKISLCLVHSLFIQQILSGSECWGEGKHLVRHSLRYPLMSGSAGVKPVSFGIGEKLSVRFSQGMQSAEAVKVDQRAGPDICGLTDFFHIMFNVKSERI